MRPWRNQILGMFRRGGWFRDLTVLLALLGFMFTATTPGLALVTESGSRIGVTGSLGVYICHVKGGTQVVLPSGEQASETDEGCCLICQAAQLAHGAVPPQHFTLPTESAVRAGVAVRAQSFVGGEDFRPAQARAPPAV